MTLARTPPALHHPRVRERILVTLSAPFATGLALHAHLGPRNDFQPRDRNAIATRHAQSEGPLREPFERAFDLLDRLPRAGRQREVAFALDTHRVALTRLLVELRVALLPLRRELL